MGLLQINLDEITVLFIGLKLSGHIDWPWWKILAPSFISIAFRLFLKLRENVFKGID